jgi:photosystem II stability/assembly factor-like uncharacterized protein
VYPDDPRRVIAACRSGIFTSADGGAAWIGRATGRFRVLDWHAVAVHPADPHVVLSELTCPRLLVRSSDGGRSWTQVDQMPNLVAWRSIEFAPSDPEIVYAGTTGFTSCGHFDFNKPARGVRVSSDGGRSWRDANDDSTRELSIVKLAVHPGDPGIVLAASAKRGAWRTEDRGRSWQPVDPQGFGDRSVTYVGFVPSNPQTLFVGPENGGLRVSRDHGCSWQTVGYGIDAEATVTDMAFAKLDGTMYLADLRSGVYRSTDGGERWRPINRGLLVRAVNGLALSDDGRFLYAATEGQGVFRLDIE